MDIHSYSCPSSSTSALKVNSVSKEHLSSGSEEDSS